MKNSLSLPVIALLVACFALAISNCGIRIETPEQKYLAARGELNLFLEEYIKIQDQISDYDHKKAKLAFESADAALDAWEPYAISGEEYDYTSDMQLWINAKEIIVKILTEVQ